MKRKQPRFRVGQTVGTYEEVTPRIKLCHREVIIKYRDETGRFWYLDELRPLTKHERGDK